MFSSHKLVLFTIKGYRSAINTVCRLKGGCNPGTDAILSSLLRAFDIELPGLPKVVPQWNLALVLQALFEDLFEPLDVCAMKLITWKTIFLVPIVSARCASCLYALSLEQDQQQPDLPGSLRFGRDKVDVTIFTNPGYLAKYQRLESNLTVVFKSLRAFIASQQEPDSKMCPELAQPGQGNCFRLFFTV